MRRAIVTLAFAVLASLPGLGCKSAWDVRKPDVGAASLTTITLDYVDSDAFDVLFESALVNRAGVVTIRTPNEKPDWTGRLNGWIAAWNKGKNPETRLFRGQFPVPSIDGDTLREFRLLVSAVVDRAEDASRSTVNWWTEERVRQRRIELLRPYNLRFHVHGDGKIHVIFFNGDQAQHYPQFVAKLMECEDEERWSRSMECSACKKARVSGEPNRVSLRLEPAVP